MEDFCLDFDYPVWSREDGVTDFAAVDRVNLIMKLESLRLGGNPDIPSSELSKLALGDFEDKFKNYNEGLSAEEKVRLEEIICTTNPDKDLQGPRLKYCPAKFDGLEDMGKVEDFLLQTTWYKMRFEISDAKAIVDLKHLFRGVARTWWDSVVHRPRSWTEITTLIKQTFEISSLFQRHFEQYFFGIAEQKRKPMKPKRLHYL